jgi:hypothetical protein
MMMSALHKDQNANMDFHSDSEPSRFSS